MAGVCKQTQSSSKSSRVTAQHCFATALSVLTSRVSSEPHNWPLRSGSCHTCPSVEDPEAQQATRAAPRTQDPPQKLPGGTGSGFCFFWKRQRLRKPVCVLDEMWTRVLPRPLPGLGLNQSPPCWLLRAPQAASAPEGQLVANTGSPFVHPTPSAEQGLHRPPLPLPAIQSHLAGALSGRV